jgi:hypothetical protein
MSEADNRVAALEHELATARRDQQAQTRSEQVKQLRETIRELHEHETELVHVEQQVKETNALLLTFNRRILIHQEAISESLSRRPASARWLTADEDPDIDRWQREHKQYESAFAELIRQRDAIPPIDRLAAVQLAQRVEYLRQAKLNLMNALDGSINKLEGGIFSVS